MIAHLFHAPIGEDDNAVGVGTVGSSEAIMLAVLRVGDVLLFQGNHVMLFRTALALMELYGIVSLAGSTFDSSQLVFTACMGYQNVNDERLQELRNKDRPGVDAALEERTKGLNMLRDSQALASKLYGFKENKSTNGGLSRMNFESSNADELSTWDVEIDSVKDLQDQVAWLKNKLCKVLEEKRSAILSKKSKKQSAKKQVEGIRLSKPNLNLQYRRVDPKSKKSDGNKDGKKHVSEVNLSLEGAASTSKNVTNVIKLKNSYSSLEDDETDWDNNGTKLSVIDESDSEDVDEVMVMEEPNGHKNVSSTGASTPEASFS
nr:hypothetical protein [Tanacetum cinerariifolium]